MRSRWTTGSDSCTAWYQNCGDAEGQHNRGTCLLYTSIEHAAGLSNAVQNELDELMERDKSGMIVVLIDTPENLEALHGNNMSLASKFQYIGADSRAQEKQQNEAALEEALLKQTEVQEKIAQEVVQGREPEPEDGFDGRTEDFRDMPEARREEPPHLEQEEPVRELSLIHI